MSTTSTVLHARARLGVEVRTKGPDSAEALTARRNLAFAKLERYVSTVVAEGPPLTADQRASIVRALETEVA